VKEMQMDTEVELHPVPWNKGKLMGQKQPLKPTEIWAIRFRLQLGHRTRDLALFNRGIDSKLRGRDLVALRVRDMAQGGRDAVGAWLGEAQLRPEDFLLPSRVSLSPHLSTRQYARILKTWVASVGLDAHDYGTHSMRRTKPTLIYRRTRNLRAVQLLLGHTKLESTIRYLGIEVEDALEIAEQTDV
jgi:site-specific recombinase XerC